MKPYNNFEAARNDNQRRINLMIETKKSSEEYKWATKEEKKELVRKYRKEAKKILGA